MPKIWLFTLVLFQHGYSQGKYAWDFEAEYTVALSGNIHNVRERLKEIAFPHYQRTIRRLYGMQVTRGEIKGKFTREQPSLASTKTIHVEFTEIVYHGRQHYGRRVGSENLRFFRYDPEPEEEVNEADEAYASDEEYEGGEGDEEEFEDDEEYADEGD